MYLKNLSLRGFKTFADKTVIEFNPPGSITAIVGPNGCGKSNVVDAIRWVLGEQNPKELRSSALEEVIFAGSSARKPLSLAEVSIDLDNSDNKIKTDFTELSIKRRTFRSGESEFFINKANCRLKDIRDLFLDTGLGGGSYSIISQGQVDAILSSKPEERRKIFEEAAKINKYKFRKTAAERKLISTEQNMLRIADLKSEIASQLAVLEEQSKKALEFNGLKEKLRTLEVGLSKKQIKSINEKKRSIEEKMAALRSQMELGLNLTQQYESEKNAKKETARALENEIEGTRLNISGAKLSYEENKSSILLEKEKKRNLEERIAELETHIGELTSKLKSLSAKEKELQAEYRTTLEARGKAEKELRTNEEKLNSAASSQEALELEINDLKTSIMEKESALSQERNRLVELESNLRLAIEESHHDEELVKKLENEKSELIDRVRELEALSVSLDEKIKSGASIPVNVKSSRETLEASFGKVHGPAAKLASDGESQKIEIEIQYGQNIDVRSVKLNNSLILSEGSITGGSLKEKVADILKKEREIVAVIEHARTSQEAEAKQLELKNTEEEIDLTIRSLSARKHEIEDITSKKASLAASIKILEEESGKLNDRLAASSNMLKNVTKEKEDLLSRYAESKADFTSVSSRSGALSKEAAAANSEMQSIREFISQRNKADMQEKLGQCNERIVELERSLPKLIEQEQVSLKNLESLQAKKVVIEKEIEELEKKLSCGTSDDRVIRDALSKEEVSLAKMDGELAAMSEKMMNEYGMTIDDVVSSDIDIPVTRSREEAEQFRKAIAALGPVNLLATEEFEKARERFNFIETQYTDLSLARENLSNLIKELDEKARADFIETLKVINANFSEIFAKLFEGGEAKLEVPEGQDILEGGIEIIARPGGKRWLNLSVMSGGERALTAIALLFALLKTHPSPFCLLDEADSALDESNVHRFTKMLKEFSLTTQVVLITHNKQTMSIVDNMYGITQEEPGVSKVISVKLAKAA